MIKVVRRESYTDGQTEHITLVDAMERFGKDELFEYLQGYSEDAAYFLSCDGKDMHPVSYQDISNNGE